MSTTMTPTAGTTITDVTVGVEPGGLAATFHLAGRAIDPRWQGALVRALGTSLTGLAGRWHFEHGALTVTRMVPQHADAVAHEVRRAVDEANAYVAEGAREAAAVLAANEVRADELGHQAQTAQAAMRAVIAGT